MTGTTGMRADADKRGSKEPDTSTTDVAQFHTSNEPPKPFDYDVFPSDIAAAMRQAENRAAPRTLRTRD